MQQQTENITGHILVIGANGGVGKLCVQLALEAGYQVTAIVRTLSKLSLNHPRLHIVKGDITDSSSISGYFENKDAVFSTLGVKGGFGKDRPTTLYSKGAATILTEMKKAGTNRAFFISASALETSPLLPYFVRLISKYIVQKLLRHMYADLRKMEKVIKSSDADWTIMRPPQMTNGLLTGHYRIAINAYLKNCLKISRADLAYFMIHHITDETICKATIEIGY